jgi:hypothetical protein
MCKEIAILKADGTADYVCTVSDLMQRMGCYIPSLDGLPDNNCLCPLDEAALAKQTGYTISCGWDTPYHCDLVMTPNVK